MSKYYNNTNYGDSSLKKSRRKNPWIICLKVFCWCIGILVILAAIALWIVSDYVSPKHITELIEKESSKYLDADIKIGKLDYKIFHSYPWLEFEVDSLIVISKSLDNVGKDITDSLPANSDLLAEVSMIKGQVNIHSLLHHKLNLRGIEIDQPKINIVMVNDSVTNFNIAKHIPHNTKIPEIDLQEIRILPPMEMNFFSLEKNVEAAVELESFFLAQDHNKNYTVGFDGIVNGRYRNFHLPSKLPVKFNTGIHCDLSSFAIKLNNLSLSVAGLAVEANGELMAGKNGIDFNKADINVRIEDFFTLITYLPKELLELISLPEGLSGILPVNFSLLLKSPYHLNPNNLNISIEELPELNATLKIEDANLAFLPPKGEKVEANDIYLEAYCDFDPKNIDETDIFIREIRVRGEGVDLNGEASLNNLLAEEQYFNGNFNFSTPLTESLSYLVPKSSVGIKGLLKGSVEFSGKSKELGKEGFSDLDVKGDLLCHALNVKSSSLGNVKVNNLKSAYHARIPQYPLNNYAGTKLKFDFTADTLSSFSAGVMVLLSDLKMNLDAMDTVSGTPDPTGDLLVKVGKISIKEGATSFNGVNLSLETSGSLNSNPASSNYTTVTSTTPGDDALIASKVSHTPLVLEYSGGGILQTAMNLLNLDLDISLEKGNFKSPSYLLPVDIEGLGLSTNLNHWAFSASDITLGKTSFSIGGELDGLKPFMTSYSATPLKTSADIDFINVDINELSWGYYGALLAQGMKKDSVFYAPPVEPFTSSDSVCVAIPRNIDATVRLRAQSAEYMQYRFSPLSTDIIVKNGVATLSKLTVGAPYCTAIVDWTYSTASLSNIFMNLKADVKNFAFSPFYNVFPSLVSKSHEIKDFTGVVNADIDCNFLMYPNMFMDSESLRASFNIKASELKFARKGKIERITHLMLIEGDQPIEIQNINITGGFHDNLLQINPFKIAFDGYQLECAGVNNTAGNMYYHLALEKSPFHLPFGVSLIGKFKHPEVRLGGTHIDDYRAEMVSQDPASNLNINIMAYLKHGWLLFVQEAAKFKEEEE